MARFLLNFIAVPLTLFLFIQTGLHAQNGQYSVRFNMNSYDCTSQTVFVDIEVKAFDNVSTFHISDQNYRFSFNRSAVPPISEANGSTAQGNNPGGNPNCNGNGNCNGVDNDFSVRIVEELDLSGFVFEGSTVSFYEPHTLNGSMDTVGTVNIAFAGGDGFPVSYSSWTKVARLEFNLISYYSCLNLEWHTHDPLHFPPTFVGEKYLGSLYEATEGSYEDLSFCLSDYCTTPLPVEMMHFAGVSEGCEIALDWSTASEENNDYFILEKSPDGIDFAEIARIAGNGTTSDESFYSYMDVASSENQYYRLIQVDFDGTRNVSETISVVTNCFGENPGHGIVVLFPNPVREGKITIEYYADHAAEKGNIIITDVMGRKIYSESTEITEGLNVVKVQTNNLAPGTYFVEVMGEGWYTAARKFVKY